MLKVENISTGYGKKQVLYDVSLEVKPGEVVLLTGGNGSGKSTLLKCIFSVLPLWSGDIYFEKEKINKYKPAELVTKGIVYIPQKEFYFENLSVEENLYISGNTLSKKELKSRIIEVSELISLTKFRKRKPFNLSGGERKILAFGMALIHKPRLLLFDEPFAGIDTKNGSVLLRLFKEAIITSENAVIIVEHKDDSKKIYNKKIKMELGNLKT